MWMLLVLLQATPALSTPSSPPALVVQVVDQSWLPVPGADVKLMKRSHGSSSHVSSTEREGYARFWVAGGMFDVEIEHPGFTKRKLKGIRLGTSTMSPTAYVQVQIKVALGDPVS